MTFELAARKYGPLFEEFRTWTKQQGREEEVFESNDGEDGIAPDTQVIRDYVEQCIWPKIEEQTSEFDTEDDAQITLNMISDVPARLFFEVQESLDYGVSNALYERSDINKRLLDYFNLNDCHAGNPDVPVYKVIADRMASAIYDEMNRIFSYRFSNTEKMLEYILE